MILKANILFCDNEHGNGDVTFPDLKMSEPDLIQAFLVDTVARSVRRAAKAKGWGRVNGGDYCPVCMESMNEKE